MTRQQWAASVLGVNPTAPTATVRAAYRDQVRVWHPDQFQRQLDQLKAAEAQTRRINLAYAILLGDDDGTPIEDLDPKYRATPSIPTAPTYRRDPKNAVIAGAAIGAVIGVFFHGWGAILGILIGAIVGYRATYRNP